MNYKEIVDYLYNLPRFTKGGHMDNVKKLLAVLSDPQDSFSYIHVAGTNGKGSVCSYIERCLRLCHKKTGLFTSPHLVRVNERIRICGQEISDEDFVRIFNIVDTAAKGAFEKGCMLPTFFEYIYLMAMVYFREKKIDYGIIEAGLGGRMDFTNAAVHPRLTVIVPVSMDHVPVLGTSLEEIGMEKAGIIKPQVPLVCGRQQKKVLDIISETALRKGAPAIFLDRQKVEIISGSSKNIDFSLESRYHGKCIFRLNTAAVYQVENAALAVLTLEELWNELKEECLTKVIDGESSRRRNADGFLTLVRDGLALAHWPGRMELIRERFYVDGAHNEAATMAFAKTIAAGFSHCPLYLIFAVAGDKDYETMIAILAQIPNLKGVIVTEIENGRRLSKDKVLEVFHKNWNGMICSTYNIKEAVKIGLSMRGEDGILCCVGSLYLVGSIKEIAGGNSDDKL